MVRRYVVLSVVVASIVVGLALNTKPLHAAAASLGTSWEATQRWVSSLGSKTIRPTERVAALLRPQRPEQQGAGQTGPTITINKTGYLVGEVVAIAGSGFAAGEGVTLSVTFADGSPVVSGEPGNFPAAADGGGNLSATWTLVEDLSGHNLKVRAVGATSGAIEAAFGTDRDRSNQSGPTTAPARSPRWGQASERGKSSRFRLCIPTASMTAEAICHSTQWRTPTATLPRLGWWTPTIPKTASSG